MSPPPKTTRYLTVKLPEHPLATGKNQIAYVHRVVLYGAIGLGVHACHWCERELEWHARGLRRLVVDHLDGDTWNNALGNLVPACRTCNCLRGKRANFLTHCGTGHEWTPESTYIRPDTGRRQCRRCSTRREALRPRPKSGVGKSRRGSVNGNAKLTEDGVRQIRQRYGTERTVDLAREYGVDPTLIWQVATRKAWRHVA